MAKCYSCGDTLLPVGTYDEDNTYQFDNALWVGFFGAYAMFVDNEFDRLEDAEIPGADYEAVICHDCAHDLCSKVPWINDLLNPYSSHSHKLSYKKDNPDHFGWDYDN